MNAFAVTLVALLALQLLPIAGRSTIRGRVLDADGQPMPHVDMNALLLLDGRQMIAGTSTTDDEGGFSIDRVPAGRIILRAQPRPPSRATADGKAPAIRAHPPAYFPGVLPLDEAWPIEVGSQEIIELDFHMPPVLVGSIKTIVSGPEGYTLEQLRVMRPEGNQIRNVRLDADGVGYAEDLREGRHVVVARGRVDGQRLAAYEIAYVSPGELTVNLALAPAAKITGRVVSDRGGIPPIGNMRVAADWTDGAIDLDPLARDAADVGPDGAFTIDGLFGTRVIRVSGLTAGWHVAAIRQGRAGVPATGVELSAGGTTEITIVLSRK